MSIASTNCVLCTFGNVGLSAADELYVICRCGGIFDLRKSYPYAGLSVSDMVEGCNQECNDYFLEKEWDVIDEKLTKIGDFGRYGGGPRPRTEGA